MGLSGNLGRWKDGACLSSLKMWGCGMGLGSKGGRGVGRGNEEVGWDSEEMMVGRGGEVRCWCGLESGVKREKGF